MGAASSHLLRPPDPIADPTSSLVLSTPGGSFTRPRFVTISIS